MKEEVTSDIVEMNNILGSYGDSVSKRIPLLVNQERA